MSFEVVVDEKMFEAKLDPGKTTIMRLDGVNFSSFVKSTKCERPFSADFNGWMISTLVRLMTDYRFDAGFTGSDEISLVWTGRDVSLEPGFTMLYSGRLQKLCSVMAAKATAAFAAALVASNRQECLQFMPAFDCRVWQVDTFEDALSSLRLRQVYTLKNARLMFAQHHLPKKNLMNVPSAEAVRKVERDHGLVFEKEVADEARIGTYALWEKVLCTASTSEVPFTRKKLCIMQWFGNLKDFNHTQETA